MLAVKSMDVRDNFKNFCEKVIMLSEAEYNKMMKAKRNADYLAMLDKSMAEAESGGFIPKTISELETFE